MKTDTKMIEFEFCIDDLGYLGEPLETRAIVMSKVLKELELQFKRYYVTKDTEGYRKIRKPKITLPDMSIAFMVECYGDYLAFAWYCYRKRMNTIIQMQKSYNSSSNDHDK